MTSFTARDKLAGVHLQRATQNRGARVTSVHPLDNYRLAVCFDDGTEGEIALEERLFGPVFEPLHDLNLFRQVFVDEFGAIAWPNGADLAPDALYEQLRASASSASQSADSHNCR